MILTEKKLKHVIKKGSYVFRPRILKWCEKNIHNNSHCFFYGFTGIGKTTEIIHFVENSCGECYGYYCLDDCDNDISQFQTYFFAMAKNAGVKNMPESICELPLRDFFSYLSNQISLHDEQYIMILDNIECLHNSDILKELFLFFKYISSKCMFIVIGNGEVNTEWIHAFLSESFQILGAGYLAMDYEEFCKMLNCKKWKMDADESMKLWKKSGGWPGVAQRLYSNIINPLQSNSGREKNAIESYLDDKILFLDLECNFVIEDIIWSRLSKKARLVLLYGSFVPFFDDELLQKVQCINECMTLGELRENIMLFEKVGLLIPESEGGCYRVSEMVRSFICSGYSIENFQDFMGKAAVWYENKGHWKAAWECLIKLNNKNELFAYFKRHTWHLIHILKINDLKQCIKIFPQDTEDVNILFWQGVYAVWTEDFEKLDVIERKIKNNKESHGNKDQLLWNLYYMDRRISAVQWILKLKEANLDCPLFLYDVSGNQPTIRCGQKDLTEFFSEGRREEKKYAKLWEQLIDPSQKIYFLIASIEYLLETDRGKEAAEKTREILSGVFYSDSAETAAGCIGIIGELYRRNNLDEGYLEVIKSLCRVLKREQFEIMLNNIKAFMIYAHSYGNSGHALYYWLSEKSEIRETIITKDNEFLQRLNAKSVFGMQKYKKAEKVYSRLVAYYKKKNIQCLVECLFGKAVALAGLEKGTEALKTATEALTLGVRFHYIEPYTGFGKIGLNLILQYQKLTENRETKIIKKKKYYYGNILSAGFEEWQSILIRCAKKEARLMSWEDQNIIEPLTKTERKVLLALSQGYSNQRIADELGIKISTVKSHVSGIFQKLGVKNRVQAVQRGKEIGLIEVGR